MPAKKLELHCWFGPKVSAKDLPSSMLAAVKRVFATLSRWYLLAGLIGLCLGITLDEGLRAFRERGGAERFQQRIRCRLLAEKYEKKESGTFAFVVIDRVDFSPSRHSCIATLSRAQAQDSRWSYETVDILTGELLYVGFCYRDEGKDSSLYCGNGFETKMMEARDKALETALK